MGNTLEEDPSPLWRRITFCGALLCTIGCMLPVRVASGILEGLGMGSTHWIGFTIPVAEDQDYCLWQILPAVFWVARGEARHWAGFERYVMGIFACLVLPALLSGPALVVAALRSIKGWVWFRLVVLIPLYLCAVLPTFCIGLVQVRECTESEAAMLFGAAAFMAYLGICGVTALLAWDSRARLSSFFWLGVVPLSEGVLAWGILFLLTQTRPPGVADYGLYLVIAICSPGSLMMLIGWLNWWRAVRTGIRNSTRPPGRRFSIS